MQFSQHVGVNNSNDETLAGPLELQTDRSHCSSLSISVLSPAAIELATTAFKHKTDVLRTLSQSLKRFLQFPKNINCDESYISMPPSL